ncbi:MAG: hypothetical protein A2Y21_00835 [Clostridiales bacterium GWC2_40_7]|nr:MAG: hypothetical protein A2Y21_00835 [Clostridiales bacterium GWC2_40_7]
MTGLGTLVNVAAVIAGGAVGVFVKKGLPERFKSIIVQAIGLSVLMIGISGVMQGMLKVVADGRLDRLYIMTMIFSMIIGGILGELINIEKKLDRLGNWFQKKLSKEGSSFSEGFVSASLLFCVGAMAIVGSLEDGLMGNPNTLYAKSILDGVISIVFASTLGIGVAFSSLSLLVYQGSITLLAFWVKPWLTDLVISQMSLVGSVLIFCIGINILEIRKIKVGNLLPAIFMPLLYYVITTLI